MLIGKKGYYSLKVMLFFAFSGGESYSIKEVSERTGISPKVLEQILLVLKNGGLLSSKRGPNGGYRLAKDITGITVMDVMDGAGDSIGILPIEPGEGKEAIDEILDTTGGVLKDQIVTMLYGVKLTDLVEKIRRKVDNKELNYFI
ncbi:MAG: Rrf2 family transcriptional regulator [Candidatus Tantalella remota]|nr:Rrf2 family transcriptional regulator [Candidatus Tantalella remota]